MSERAKPAKVLTPKERRAKALCTALAVLIGLLFLFPLYWLAMYSFKSNNEVLIVSLWPLNPTLDAWKAQFADSDFILWVRNSVVIALLAMGISVVLSVPAAYGLGRFNLPGKGGILLLFLVTQMMPASLLLTPMFLTFSRLKLLNTHLAPALAVSTMSIPFIVVTLRPYFLAIPKSLDEAAIIDGCNPFTSFIRIMLPVIRTGLITCVVITFLHGWNDLVFSMTFNVNKAMRPLTANINSFIDKYGTKWNAIMAYGMLLVLPVTLAFIFLQKHIVGGLTAGAVKG